MRENHFGKTDILLIAAAIGMGAVMLLVFMLTGRAGTGAQVRVDGRVIASFSLSEDRTYKIIGAAGGQNLLVIENGTARIEEADCPDALCVGMGRIRRVGQSVVCLPHKVVVEIVGAADDTGVDIVVG